MCTEWELRQAAIDSLHSMLRSKKPKKFSNVKAEICLGVLQEMREADEDKEPEEWVKQLFAETAIENARDKRNRD